MPEPYSFQSAFFRALLDRPDEDGYRAGPRDGLAVYRNTAIKALIDALVDNYPTVERLVGSEWFAACAGEFVRAHPPSSPVLALYGHGFSEHLACSGVSVELPYLPEVARIDRLWTEAHFARDAPSLRASTLAHLTPKQIFGQRIALHAATRFGWFDHSAVTIWLQNRPPAEPPSELQVDGSSEGVLLTRPAGAVIAHPIDAVTFAFLSSVRDGTTLGAAATAALAVDSNADLGTQLAKLIGAGAFAEPASYLGSSA